MEKKILSTIPHDKENLFSLIKKRYLELKEEPESTSPLSYFLEGLKYGMEFMGGLDYHYYEELLGIIVNGELICPKCKVKVYGSGNPYYACKNLHLSSYEDLERRVIK